LLSNAYSPKSVKIDKELIIFLRQYLESVMFISELSPLFKELAQHPVSFMGGFVSGVLRLNLNEDPVKTWLGKYTTSGNCPQATTEAQNGKASGPQQISID
jgi:hypothetical protein